MSFRTHFLLHPTLVAVIMVIGQTVEISLADASFYDKLLQLESSSGQLDSSLGTPVCT